MTTNRKSYRAMCSCRLVECDSVKIYKAILFWFGGLFTETLAHLSKKAIFPDISGRQLVDTQIKLRSVSEQLILGKINQVDFCQAVAEICGSGLTPEEVEIKMRAKAALNEEVFEIIGGIPQKFLRWLVVDYPEEWFFELAEGWSINSIIPDNQIILTGGMNLDKLVPDVFYHLPSSAGQALGDCLVIDPDTSRAVTAMRHGLASIIYVYPKRLIHELALQGIWKTDEDVMHPTSSERVNI